MHCLKNYLRQSNKKSVNYFEFCFHPTDFSRSVANAFYTSFLLKENKVGLDIGDDDMPRLSKFYGAKMMHRTLNSFSYF